MADGSEDQDTSPVTMEEENGTLDPDQGDIFKMKKLKKLVSCTVNKFKLKDEDNLPYGFDIESDDDNEEARSRAVYEVVGNTIVSNQSFKRSLDTPVSVDRPATRANIKVPEPYPCQTNAQIYPDPRCPQTRVLVDEDQYDFSHLERGYMVTIVNDRFTRQAKREGAHWDLLKMKEISRKLGFRHFNYGKERNLTKQATLNLLRRI